MFVMKHLSILVGAVILALVAGSAAPAQMVLHGGSRFNPPLPPPPPPPRIEVPVVRQMDAPPSQPRVQASGRGSFSDRISRCLDEAAANGIRASRRAAYSRACANR
jgi:hypothetical protein